MGTSATARYSIDACSLIDLNRYYPSATFPVMWRLIEGLADAGRLAVCEQARDECRDAPLRAFMAAHSGCVIGLLDFEPLLAGLLGGQEQLGIEAVRPAAETTEADPFVIALALWLDGRVGDDIASPGAGEQRGVVVTEERSRATAPFRKIPDICDALHLEHATLLEMPMREGYSG